MIAVISTLFDILFVIWFMDLLRVVIWSFTLPVRYMKTDF